jgi:hypothetical protein
MCIWVDNIKMDIRETSFAFRLNFISTPGKEEVLAK